MPFIEAIRLALNQLRVQKLKSFFTLLGVTISVMFLIAVVSIVEGMNHYVEVDFAGKFLGVNTFTLRRFPQIEGDVTEDEWRAWQRRPYVTLDDAAALQEVLPADARWSLASSGWENASSAYNDGGVQVIAEATSASYFTIKDLGIKEGRAFTEEEDVAGLPVIVIGTEIADAYFPYLDPIGRELRVKRFPFRVIGVIEKQGTVFGLSLDRQVIAPFHSQMGRLTSQRTSVGSIIVQAPAAASFHGIQELVREAIRNRHRLRPSQPDDFALESSESALTQWETIHKYLVLAGMVLPAIGLVVGAIVIMNIMLVAVSERTVEIGIRKSLGARRRDILSQFLVESATLSVVGAILGVGLGIALAELVAAVSPLPAHVALWSIALSVGIGGGVGIVAGAYPAGRASRLDPILAMRAE